MNGGAGEKKRGHWRKTKKKSLKRGRGLNTVSPNLVNPPLSTQSFVMGLTKEGVTKTQGPITADSKGKKKFLGG